MRLGIWLGFVLAASAGIPFVLRAQVLTQHSCHTCYQPVVQCQCLRTRPVVQTQLREEKVTTYRDVVETRYREECVVEHKPVTTYEDRIETVWVPQQVTKKVAKTVLVPETKARSVPYQVVQRIPQTTTRMVPYQTVHHVTEAVPMTAFVPGAPVISHAWIAPTPVPTTVAMPLNPTLPQASAVVPHRAPPLAPTTTKNPGGWQTIPPRSASNDRYGGYDSDYESSEPAFRKSSWRGGVPAAAAAWNYNDRTYR